MIHFAIPLKISTEKYLSLLNKGHNKPTEIIDHGRKNLPRQIDHLPFPEVTVNCDYPEKRND